MAIFLCFSFSGAPSLSLAMLILVVSFSLYTKRGIDLATPFISSLLQVNDVPGLCVLLYQKIDHPLGKGDLLQHLKPLSGFY